MDCRNRDGFVALEEKSRAYKRVRAEITFAWQDMHAAHSFIEEPARLTPFKAHCERVTLIVVRTDALKQIMPVISKVDAHFYGERVLGGLATVVLTWIARPQVNLVLGVLSIGA